MADPAAIRTALTRLGFSNDAAQFITGDQGMTDLTEFELLTDEEVESLCRVIRRPGGTLANPNAAQPNQPATIPNPGIAVPLRAENNMKLACFFLRYRKKTSRTTTPGDILLDDIRKYVPHKEWEKDHQDVESPEINARDWPRTVEAIEEWLRGTLGVTKIPLAYVVREDTAVPTNDPAEGYASKQDELIARAPIMGANDEYEPTYLTDRGRVWELLSELTREHDCWSYVRPAQRTRDGRMAFLGLRGHYLGVNNVDNMSSRAEAKLQTTTYTGEKRRWNFEKYVKVHIDQHAVLEGLKQHGYAGVDDRSKVRHLLAGIKTTALDTVKTRIMSDATLRSDFDACVNLFQDFIEQSASTGAPRDVTIAAVRFADQPTTSTSSSGKPSPQADMSIEDRYYTKAEYEKMTNAQKYGLKLKRDQRGHQAGARDSKRPRPSGGGGGNRNGVDLSNRSIKAIASAIREQGDDEDEDDEADTDESPAKKAKAEITNRNNPALTKKKGKRG